MNVSMIEVDCLGLALLQRHRKAPNFGKEPVEAPEALIQEAAVLHQFAEAAYTVVFLDMPLCIIGQRYLFDCVIIHTGSTA